MRSQGQRVERCTGRLRRVPALALAFVAALPLAPGALRAEPGDERPPAERRRTLTADRQLGLEGASERRPPAWVDHLHIQKGTGLEYRRRLRMGERPVEVGVQGPVVRKRKSLGLTLVVRF